MNRDDRKISFIFLCFFSVFLIALTTNCKLTQPGDSDSAENQDNEGFHPSMEGENPPPGESWCPEVCEKLIDCDLMGEGENCLEICEESFSEDQMECIMQTPCEAIQEECFSEIAPDCEFAAQRLLYCDLLRLEEMDPWIRMCREEFSEDTLWCIAEVACEDILEVCLEGGEEKPCPDAFWKMVDCGMLPPEEEEIWIDFCFEELPPDTVWCILEVPCPEVGVCFEYPPPEEKPCFEAFEKLLDCGWVLEPDWIDFCFVELPPEAVWCILEVPCPDVEICFEYPPPEEKPCFEAFEKLLDCGWVLEPDWIDFCFVELPPEAVWCILEVPCEEIEEICLDNN